MTSDALNLCILIMTAFIIYWATVYPRELKEVLLFQENDTPMSVLVWMYIITDVLLIIYGVI